MPNYNFSFGGPRSFSGFSDIGSVADFVLVLYLLFVFVLFAFLIASYVISSIGMYKMAKRRNFSSAWMAWIPYARDHLMGCLSGDVMIGSKRLKNTALWSLLVPIILKLIVGIFIAFINVMVMLATTSALARFPGRSFPDLPSMFGSTIIGMIFIYALLIVFALIESMFRAIIYYNIFSVYADKNMSFFYTMLSLFVPLARSILFCKMGGRDVQNSPEHPHKSEGQAAMYHQPYVPPHVIYTNGGAQQPYGQVTQQPQQQPYEHVAHQPHQPSTNVDNTQN